MSQPSILVGDVLDMLRTLPDESVNCVVTSPPYWGLRDYGVDGQIGLEKTPAEYVARMVGVFEEVCRVLRKDGTCWVNIGDSYWTDSPVRATASEAFSEAWDTNQAASRGGKRKTAAKCGSLKNKDLVGIPWRLAFALQDAGWYLRSEIIWAKPNPMPENVRDRPTKAHEQIFLLTKSPKYWYDADAIRTELKPDPRGFGLHNGYNPPGQGPHGGGMSDGVKHGKASYKMPDGWDTGPGGHGSFHRNGREKGAPASHKGSVPGRKDGPGQDRREAGERPDAPEGANARTVWVIPTKAYPEAHFATFPPEIPKRCILAGCPVGGVVLDPFLGSGTTAAVAVELGRKWIGIELNPEYAELARRRISDAQPCLEVA